MNLASISGTQSENLIKNLDSNKIGVYANELIPNLLFAKKSVVL